MLPPYIDVAREASYPTPYATSPLLPMLLLSLATQKNAPKLTTTLKDEYDYVIVGGGTAGATLAARLSEKACASVLLLEAGTGKPPLLSDVPALAKKFRKTDIDWAYKSVPQKHTGFALQNRQLPWPGGKTLGGGSVLNSMMYVRGNRQNYDDWAANGAKGWSFEEVFPYFIKQEDNRDNYFLRDGYHGTVGPITAERPKYEPALKTAVREGSQLLGLDIVDSNAAQQSGFNIMLANHRNGQRCSTAKAYLVPVENRTNLYIVADAHVNKIILNGNTAVGVEVDFNNQRHQVKARREVIISAGSVNTAQLLMLSGIGPKEHLQKFQIPVVADLPVGSNLQNHYTAILAYALDPSIPEISEKFGNESSIYQYVNHRSGVLAATDFYLSMAFLRNLPEHQNIDFPDTQMFFVEMSDDFPRSQIGLKPEVYQKVFQPYEGYSKFACLSQVLQPKSRGTVRLNSSSPYEPPLIDPNYLESDEDLKCIVEGMKFCNRLVETEPMKKIGAKKFDVVFPGCEEEHGDEDKYLACIARGFVKTLSHPTSVCKMGDPNDPTTVVDPQLRVKGIQHLRVVDASVMPTITSGNTNIPTVMVAEKAADIIKETILCDSE